MMKMQKAEQWQAIEILWTDMLVPREHGCGRLTQLWILCASTNGEEANFSMCLVALLYGRPCGTQK